MSWDEAPFGKYSFSGRSSRVRRPPPKPLLGSPRFMYRIASKLPSDCAKTLFGARGSKVSMVLEAFQALHVSVHARTSDLHRDEASRPQRAHMLPNMSGPSCEETRNIPSYNLLQGASSYPCDGEMPLVARPSDGQRRLEMFYWWAKGFHNAEEMFSVCLTGKHWFLRTSHHFITIDVDFGPLW